MYHFYFPRDDVREALKQYQRASTKFIEAKPSIEASEAHFRQSFEKLLHVLDDEQVRGPVEEQLEIAVGARVEFDINERFLGFETQVINSLIGKSAKEGRVIVLSGFQNGQIGLERISSVEALKALVTQSFHSIIEKTNAARQLERKEKKKRKKQILASSAYICTGVSAILGNVFANMGAFTTPSITAGAGAVVKGFTDLYAAQ